MTLGNMGELGVRSLRSASCRGRMLSVLITSRRDDRLSFDWRWDSCSVEESLEVSKFVIGQAPQVDLADNVHLSYGPVSWFDAVLMLVRLLRLAPGALQDDIAGGELRAIGLRVLSDVADDLHRSWRKILRVLLHSLVGRLPFPRRNAGRPSWPPG